MCCVMCQINLVAVSGWPVEGVAEQHHEQSIMSGLLQPPRSLYWHAAGVAGDFVNSLDRKTKKQETEISKKGRSSSVTSCKQLGVLWASDKSKTTTTNKKKKRLGVSRLTTRPRPPKQQRREPRHPLKERRFSSLSTTYTWAKWFMNHSNPAAPSWQQGFLQDGICS